MAMHDSYHALLTEDATHTRAIAANQLLKNVPIHSADSFKDTFAEMSLDIEMARLEKVLVDAFFLARNALSGSSDLSNTPDYHVQNARWLTDTIKSTGCAPAQGNGRNGPTPLPSLASDEPNQASTDIENNRQRTARASVLIAVLIALIISATCYAIYQSRHFRIKRIQRLPRHAVAFKASGDFNGKSGPIIVLDISVGGAKIECDHPPVAKEPVTLHLPCGTVPASVVWATAFYAGVMFDAQLTDDQLQSVLNDESVTTRSRLSNIY